MDPSFTPAAAYLLEGPPKLPRNVELIRVDTDVGPMLTHPADSEVGRIIRETGTWEPGEGRFLRATLRPGMNALDVGANIGYFTLLMASAVGDVGRVLAIEADAESFPILRANVALNNLGNVELLPVAADRAAGLRTITRNPRNHGGSTAVRATAGWRSTPVQAVALDAMLDPDMPLHVVKIDVEGMDHAVVQGLAQTIARWRPTILVEFNPGWLDVLGERPEDILRAYRALGYEVRLLGGDALRLQGAGMALDELLLDNLVIRPEGEASLIAHTRTISFVNLVLTPIANRTIGSGRSRGR